MIMAAPVPGTDWAVFIGGVSALPGEIPGEAVFLKQVHGSLVLDSPEALSEGDGMVFPADGNRFPGILAADCLPVMAIWPDRIGCAHAGWRGLAQGVVESLVKAGGGPPDTVVLGPCICAGCYRVGEEVRSLASRDGHPAGGFDLKLEAASRLHPDTRIFTLDKCTLCSPGFHSHRRNAASLRNRVWLAPFVTRHDIFQFINLTIEPYDNPGRMQA
jgi:copper oxidase (laccase) domain-containing protein